MLPDVACAPVPAPPIGRETFYRFVYPSRVLGMASAGLAVAGALYQLQPTPWHWLFLAFAYVLWPHLAYLHARHSAHPYGAERLNLMMDSVLIGLWIPLMHFNVLPSALISIITTFDKGYTLYKRLWLHSLLGLLAAATVLNLALRPVPHLESSTIGVLCTLPLVFAYTWFNAYRGARHMHAINHQNWQLDELRRLDTQTGLQAREHWQDRAATVLRTFHTRSQPVCLMLIDIDHFKTINDTCGHTVGDEVISAVGKVILASVRHEDNAGRYGGDEFAVVAEADIAVAQSIGEAIRAQIEQLRFASAPQLRLTSSIGLAMAQLRHADLRDWINAADAALYRAKHLGRNQVAEVGR